MTDSPCRDCMPRACAEAFADMRETLGRVKTIAEATHRQAAETHGRVGDLFALAAERRAELARLETEMEQVRRRQAEQETFSRKLLAAGWRLAVMLAGVVASLLGLKHLIR